MMSEVFYTGLYSSLIGCLLAMASQCYKSKCKGDDQTKDYFGVVADEVDAAGIKELVSYGADGEVEGFQYERLTVVLLKAIQTLKAEVDILKAQLNGASA